MGMHTGVTLSVTSNWIRQHSAAVDRCKIKSVTACKLSQSNRQGLNVNHSALLQSTADKTKAIGGRGKVPTNRLICSSPTL